MFANSLRTALIVAAAVGMSACVTINIYFPAAAAEKAADRIIDEVWQLRQDQKPAEGQQSQSPK